jgi:glycosyltransferase involved in cell wall biosynthesis
MQQTPRIFLAVGGKQPQVPEPSYRESAERGDALRNYLFPEVLNAGIVNENNLHESSSKLRKLYPFIPKGWAIAYETFQIRKQVDCIVTWGTQITIGFMFLQWILRDKTPHVAMLYWMSKTPTRNSLRIYGATVARIVTWASVQYHYTISRIQFPKDKIGLVKRFVDENFWRHQPGTSIQKNLIAAVGSEMRDYDTFIQAMQNTNIECVIATKEIRVIRPGRMARVYSPEEISQSLPSNIKVTPHSLHDLRKLYDTAALIVIPILPSDTDNGVTVILEAMAMGKTVVCSRTQGQVDVIEHGVNGFYVNPQDPKALRELVESLLSAPEKLRQIGENARKHVEIHHTLRKFSEDVKTQILMVTTPET